MKVLLLAGFCVFVSNTALALECAVNERLLDPVDIELEETYSMCISSSLGGKLCKFQTTLKYGAEQVESNMKSEFCGYKGSDLVLEHSTLLGTAVICRGDIGVKVYKLPGFPCSPAKSKDGKYDLILCTDLRNVVTLAFPVGSKGREPGILLTHQLGNPKVISVNQVTCGEGRTRSELKSKATPKIPRDPMTERSI